MLGMRVYEHLNFVLLLRNVQRVVINGLITYAYHETRVIFLYQRMRDKPIMALYKQCSDVR